MCFVCVSPAVGHWTDAGGRHLHERLKIRFARANLINELLKPLGICDRRWYFARHSVVKWNG